MVLLFCHLIYVTTGSSPIFPVYFRVSVPSCCHMLSVTCRTRFFLPRTYLSVSVARFLSHYGSAFFFPAYIFVVHVACFLPFGHMQAPLPPSAGAAGYALRLQGQQCMEVTSTTLQETGELVMGVWLNPSQVRQPRASIRGNTICRAVSRQDLTSKT